MLSSPAVARSATGQLGAFFSTRVSGPGQNAFASRSAAAVEHRKALGRREIGHMRDQRIERRPAFRRIELRHRRARWSRRRRGRRPSRSETPRGRPDGRTRRRVGRPAPTWFGMTRVATSVIIWRAPASPASFAPRRARFSLTDFFRLRGIDLDEVEALLVLQVLQPLEQPRHRLARRNAASAAGTCRASPRR